MSLPLPEALLLFALHPERGTILPSAYLSIDVGLRAAVLAELKLVGHVQARRDGRVRVHPEMRNRPQHPALRDVLDVLTQDCPEGTVRDWYELLERRLPDLKSPVAAVLRRRGLVRAVERQRSHLPQQPTFPPADPSAREDQILLLRASLGDGDDITPRSGMLLGLVAMCHLERSLFSDQAAVATARAEWVYERDAILRMGAGMVAEAEEV